MSDRAKSVSLVDSPEPAFSKDFDKNIPDQRKELEEEEYLERMTRIIERDFYPLTRSCRLRSTDDGLFAITPSSSASEHLRTPGTYSSINSNKTDQTFRSYDPDKGLSLDEFFLKYNSGDNKSFDKLQIESRRRHRLKYPWLHSKNEQYNNKVENQIKLPSITEQAHRSVNPEGSRMSGQAITWKHDSKSAIYNITDLDTAQKGGDQRVSTINHRATRLKDDHLFKKPPPVDCSARSKSNYMFVNGIGIDGKPVLAGETPKVGGYSFVPASPSFLPDTSPDQQEGVYIKFEDHEDDKKPELGSKPGGSSICPDTPQFRVAGMSERDILAHKLLEKARKSRCDTPMKQERFSPYSARSVNSMMSIFSPPTKSRKR